VPLFELSATELLLALVRGVFVAVVLSSFGATFFLCVLAPAGLARACLRRGFLDRTALSVSCVVESGGRFALWSCLASANSWRHD
jgi:hypothetical protein